MNSLRFLVLLIAVVAHSQQGIGQQRWTLQQCVERALGSNISVKQSALNTELAEVNQKNAFGNLLPNLNAQGSHGYNWGQRIDPFTNQFASERIRSNSMGISTAVNLFNGFQAQNGLKQSRIDLAAARFNDEKIRNDIALNVASLYLALLMNKEMEEIARSNAENTANQSKRIRTLVNNGQLAQNSLDDIEAQVAADQASLVGAVNNTNLARLALAQALFLSPAEMQAFDIESPDASAAETAMLPISSAAAVQHSLSNFPEVKNAELQVTSADIATRIALGGQMPSLSASFSYGTGYSGAAQELVGEPEYLAFPIGIVQTTGDIVLSAQEIYAEDDFQTISFEEQLTDNVNKSLFFSLTIPIFNGFGASSAVKRAEINKLNAELTLDQVRQNLTQSVERAYADALAAKSNYDASKLSVQAAERAFANAERRYEQGAGTQVEYADARTRLDNARTSELNSKYDYLFKIRVLEFYEGKAINLNP
ncbi:MAG: hypothetical protein RL220_1465 [Bacteroidota bacterium]